MNRKKFIKKLKETNQQELWLAEYNIVVARDIIWESKKRIPYLQKEIERQEQEQEKLGSVEVQVGMMKDHYEKLKKGKEYIKDLRKELEGEETNIREARAKIRAYKNQILKAQMLIDFQTRYNKNEFGRFNLNEEIDDEPKKVEEDNKPTN